MQRTCSVSLVQSSQFNRSVCTLHQSAVAETIQQASNSTVLSMTINCSERLAMLKFPKYTLYPDKDDRYHVYYNDGCSDEYCISGPMGAKRDYLTKLIANHEEVVNYDWTPFELPIKSD
jgi:hypothetical protein